MREQLREQFQRDKQRLADAMAAPGGVRKMRTQLNIVRIATIALVVVSVLVTILLGIKINNTSNWALHYDPYVQQQVGQWVMGVGLMWIVTLVMGAVWIIGVRNVSHASADRVAAIRARLVEIETELEARGDEAKADLRAERQLLESDLRELGA